MSKAVGKKVLPQQDDEMGPTDVALLTGINYQTARKMLLNGFYGPVRTVPPRTHLVKRAAVEDREAERKGHKSR